MLCLDDYFMIEVDRIEKDPESGKRVKKKVMLILFTGLIISLKLILHYFFLGNTVLFKTFQNY